MKEQNYPFKYIHHVSLFSKTDIISSEDGIISVINEGQVDARIIPSTDEFDHWKKILLQVRKDLAQKDSDRNKVRTSITITSDEVQELTKRSSVSLTHSEDSENPRTRRKNKGISQQLSEVKESSGRKSPRKESPRKVSPRKENSDRLDSPRVQKSRSSNNINEDHPEGLGGTTVDGLVITNISNINKKTSRKKRDSEKKRWRNQEKDSAKYE